MKAKALQEQKGTSMRLTNLRNLVEGVECLNQSNAARTGTIRRRRKRLSNQGVSESEAGSSKLISVGTQYIFFNK